MNNAPVIWPGHCCVRVVHRQGPSSRVRMMRGLATAHETGRSSASLTSYRRTLCAANADAAHRSQLRGAAVRWGSRELHRGRGPTEGRLSCRGIFALAWRASKLDQGSPGRAPCARSGSGPFTREPRGGPLRRDDCCVRQDGSWRELALRSAFYSLSSRACLPGYRPTVDRLRRLEGSLLQPRYSSGKSKDPSARFAC